MIGVQRPAFGGICPVLSFSVSDLILFFLALNFSSSFDAAEALRKSSPLVETHRLQYPVVRVCLEFCVRISFLATRSIFTVTDSREKKGKCTALFTDVILFHISLFTQVCVTYNVEAARSCVWP